MCGVWQKEKHSCRIKVRKCTKEVEEKCTCQLCAAHPQAICFPTSRALHWLTCHYTLQMGCVCVFIYTSLSVWPCCVICLCECDVLVFVHPSACACVLSDCASPVSSCGTCLAIITPVLWGFLMNAVGGQVEGLRGITRVTDQEGFHLRLDPDYGLTCERMAQWGCSWQILMTATSWENG